MITGIFQSRRLRTPRDHERWERQDGAGTSSVTHLRENVAAAALALPSDAIVELDAIGR
jgi:hypothetical protein